MSAALLEPVRDDSGRTVDFTVRAGNHVRSAAWRESPDRHVGRRLREVQPGAAAGGLIDALAGVLRSGRALKARAVDCTERRGDGLHRTQLLYDAASCGDRVLATWRPVHNPAERLSLDAQYIASMGWGTWDLLSGPPRGPKDWPRSSTPMRGTRCRCRTSATRSCRRTCPSSRSC
ncbi:hypothetical protein ACWGF3_35565 [Streptomyces xanthophaeus]|uniref:hypothetical protein n=1 Tax=Streptomyces xanthophaeus TaxID=67385 RepID=UPI000691CE77|nr:hypothetical protein [Streptomyces xanthophaeus]